VEWFTSPEQVNLRRYEAPRAFHVEGLTHAQYPALHNATFSGALVVGEPAALAARHAKVRRNG
jgi:hypothetical protein